jgi:hypothetical protein
VAQDFRWWVFGLLCGLGTGAVWTNVMIDLSDHDLDSSLGLWVLIPVGIALLGASLTCLAYGATRWREERLRGELREIDDELWRQLGEAEDELRRQG